MQQCGEPLPAPVGAVSGDDDTPVVGGVAEASEGHRESALGASDSVAFGEPPKLRDFRRLELTNAADAGGVSGPLGAGDRLSHAPHRAALQTERAGVDDRLVTDL